MRSLVFLFLTIILCLDLNAQQVKSYNKAMIWRGLEHKWTYNHRINRIGNYVTFSEGKAQNVHMSATGLGSDSTFAKTHYTYIESPHVYFKEEVIKILVNGEEGDLLTKAETVNIPIPEYMSGKNKYNSLVNGFEIKSLKRADQLQMFRFYLEEPKLITETNQLQVTAHMNLVTNCRTIECEVLKNLTAYELTLHVLLVAYDNDDCDFTNAYATRNYVWDTKVEIDELNKELKIEGQKDIYPKACLGIRGLGIIMNEEHWLLNLNHFITPLGYDSSDGSMRSSVNMKFVAWNKEMELFSVSPFKAKFAKRKSGFALLDMNVNLLQFKEARIHHGHSKASLYWKGNNQNSDSPAAISTIDVTQKIKSQIKDYN